MTQPLRQAARLTTVGELASSIAHEPDEPLATMSPGLESLLAPTPNGDPKRGALEAIRADSSHRAFTRSVFNTVRTAGE